MPKKLNTGIAFSSIIFFIGCIGVIVSLAFPVKQIKNESIKNIINSSCQLAIALSEYGSSETDSPEQLKAFERAKEQLAYRLDDNTIKYFADEKEELKRENALNYLNLALSDISGFFGLVYIEMRDARAIEEFTKLINNAYKNLSILNLLKLNLFVSKNYQSFTKRTAEKASFHSWLLFAIILSVFITLGAVIMVMFRRIRVPFLTIGFLGALLLSALLFMLLLAQDVGFINQGVMIVTPTAELEIGAIISVSGGLFMLIGALTGINSNNWLTAIVFYFAIIVSLVVLYFYFSSTFTTSQSLTLITFRDFGFI